MTSWKKLLAEYDGYISYNTLSTEQLEHEFDECGGAYVGFYAWSVSHVYFDLVIDGRATVRRVPRSPQADYP